LNLPDNIAITGASSGLGATLALEYAMPGKNLFISARSQQGLERVGRECRKRGAEVVWRQVDITKADEVENWITEIESAAKIDLLIANAGIFTGHGGDGNLQSADELSDLIKTNLIGTMTTVNAIAPYMQARGCGHIAMISSLAGVQPLADAPAYSASKAGITSYSDALREYMIDYGVTISVILLGHMETAQTKAHIGPLPGIISAQKAARIIHSALDRGKTYVGIPKSMHLLVRLQRLLPWRLRALINRPQRFHVEKSKDD